MRTTPKPVRLALTLALMGSLALTRLLSAAEPAPYPVEPQFALLRFGEVMPTGWIREQIRRDLDGGFAGHLPEVAPFTCASGIFGANRNQPDKVQNAGGGSWGGAEGMWWKGETEGNWRSGNTMLALLAGSPKERADADARVEELLKSQDADGYMGIYAPSLRWASGNLDNGELWTQTCIFRGLLAYYEATGRKDVLAAVEKAVHLTMSHYGEGVCDPFGSETQNHNLMFVDVVERLYDLTGDRAYRDFGVYLYRAYSKVMKTDVALPVLLARDHPFVGHGATTYEGLRVPLFAAYATGDPVLAAAAEQAFSKAWPHVSPTGGPVSDEFIEAKPTDPNTGGYEGCGQKEWMTSLLSAVQKTGRATLAEATETTFYNAVQGSRTTDGKEMDYVTTDNIYKIDGAIMNRCIMSPAHEDVADCCAPNFTQIGGIFVRSMWMRSKDGLALVLPGPCDVHTQVGGVAVHLTEDTSYPFSEKLDLTVEPAQPVAFVLQVRVPSWATGVTAECPGAQVLRAGDWLLATRRWQAGDHLRISFATDVRPVPATNGEFYVRRGPLFYAVGIPAIKKAVKDYPVADFHDYLVFPATWGQARYALARDKDAPGLQGFALAANPKADARFPWDQPPMVLKGSFMNLDTAKMDPVEMVPMGSSDALLRRMTFPGAQ